MNADDVGALAVELSVAAWTDPGRRREENQDNFLVADLSVGPSDGGLLLQPGEAGSGGGQGHVVLGPLGLFAAVADGMGGAAGGRVASQLAIAWTYRELISRWKPETADVAGLFASALGAAVQSANGHVHEQGQRNPQFSGMGSTMTALGLLGSQLYVAHVGDSRAYVVRSGAVHRLTRDHSLVQRLVEAGAMTAEEAVHSPHGSVLLQALGSAPEVDVDLSWQQVCRGDVVILCSDGLFRVVTDPELATSAAATGDITELCRSLVQLANERGGPDNVTVVALKLAGDGLPDPAPTRTVSVPALPTDS